MITHPFAQLHSRRNVNSTLRTTSLARPPPHASRRWLETTTDASGRFVQPTCQIRASDSLRGKQTPRRCLLNAPVAAGSTRFRRHANPSGPAGNPGNARDEAVHLNHADRGPTSDIPVVAQTPPNSACAGLVVLFTTKVGFEAAPRGSTPSPTRDACHRRGSFLSPLLDDA